MTLTGQWSFKLLLGASKMATGTVKWFRRTAGYGFITPDDGSEEVFVHYSGIGNENLRVLTEKQHVSYEIKKGPNGPLAINVQT